MGKAYLQKSDRGPVSAECELADDPSFVGVYRAEIQRFMVCLSRLLTVLVALVCLAFTQPLAFASGAFKVSSMTATNASDCTSPDGSIEITLDASLPGTSPYAVSLDNGQTWTYAGLKKTASNKITLNGVVWGNYTLTVRDASGSVVYPGYARVKGCAFEASSPGNDNFVAVAVANATTYTWSTTLGSVANGQGTRIVKLALGGVANGAVGEVCVTPTGPGCTAGPTCFEIKVNATEICDNGIDDDGDGLIDGDDLDCGNCPNFTVFATDPLWQPEATAADGSDFRVAKPSNFTAGVPGGEIGGLFHRASTRGDKRPYYASSFASTYTDANSFNFSGELLYKSPSGAEVILGFFKRGDSRNTNWVGIHFNDQAAGTFRATLTYADGDINTGNMKNLAAGQAGYSRSADVIAASDVPTTFSIAYNAATRQMTGRIGTTSLGTLTIPSTQTFVVNGFGLSMPENLPGLGSQTATLYFDALCARIDGKPAQTEICGNGIDDDDDGIVDCPTLAGRIYEDINYGGGVGRSYAAAASSAVASGWSAGNINVAGAKIELYVKSGGAFVAATTSDANGNYTFGETAPGTYTVRVVSGSVKSNRVALSSGPKLIAVQTARMQGATPVGNEVGGRTPDLEDAGENKSNLSWTNAMDGSSGPVGPHSYTDITVASAPVPSLDFGFNFNTVTTTRDGGQGSLRQFILNANALSNDKLDQDDAPVGAPVFIKPPGHDVSIFMLRGAAPFTITPNAELPQIKADRTHVTGYTQSGAMVGPNATRTIAVGIHGNTILFDGIFSTASQTTISGLAITAMRRAVFLSGGSATGSHIWGNYIGLRPDGSTAGPNSSSGVMLQSQANVSVGTNGDGVDDASEGNVVSQNYEGITVRQSQGCLVAGNFVGLDRTGKAKRPNQYIGIHLRDNTGPNVVGLDDARPALTASNARNVGSGNGTDGVRISSSDLQTIAGNYLGTDLTGLTDLGNVGYGVQFLGSCSNNVVGSNANGNRDVEERNVMSANGTGLRLAPGSSGSNNSITSNYIGVDASGQKALPNLAHGVDLAGNQTNTYLGTNGDNVRDDAEGNVISGNSEDGVRSTMTTRVYLSGNKIGVGADGTTAIANGKRGIFLAGGAADHIIGYHPGMANANASVVGNIIRNQSDAGVAHFGTGTNNRISRNSFGANFLSVDLNYDVVSPNDDGDTDGGANLTMNFPVLTYAKLDGNVLQVKGFAPAGAEIELYVADLAVHPAPLPVDYTTSFGEGETYVATVREGSATDLATDRTTYKNDGTGATSTKTENRFDITITLGAVPAALASGRLITSTATDGANNTSEFGGRVKLMVSEICDNGIDDDGNGLVDCLDGACASTISCNCDATTELVFVISDGDWNLHDNTGALVKALPGLGGNGHAFDFVNGYMYYGLSAGLYRRKWDGDTKTFGAAEYLTVAAPGLQVTGGTFDIYKGHYYVTVTSNDNRVFRYDVKTGLVATISLPAGQVHGYGDLAWHPKTGHIYGVTVQRRLYKFHPSDPVGSYSIVANDVGYLSGLGIYLDGSAYATINSATPKQWGRLDLSNGAFSKIADLTTNPADIATLYCSSPAKPEVCDNGIDDDLDGLVDENDPDCFSNCTIVTNTKDAGYGSLRQAIICANTKPGLDTIKFNIPKSDAGFDESRGVFRIAALSSLPLITDSLLVDGGTQTKFTGDSNPGQLGTGGTVGVDGVALGKVDAPEVEIYGAPAAETGLYANVSRVEIRRLAIYGFSKMAIEFASTTRVLERIYVRDNVIGSRANAFALPADRSTSTHNDLQNVRFRGVRGGIIERNLIGFSGGFGIGFSGNGNRDNVVRQNEIRGNAVNVLNRDGIGFYSTDAQGTLVTENLIVDNAGPGYDDMRSTGRHRVINNTITRNGFGTATAASQEPYGIRVHQSDNSVFARNVITNNYGAGVFLAQTGSGNTLTQNSIHVNGTSVSKRGDAATGQLGIDLLSPTDNLQFGLSPFLTKNDAGDLDVGANGLLNFPVFTRSQLLGDTIYLEGLAPAGSVIEVFVSSDDANNVIEGVQIGEGMAYVTSLLEGGTGKGAPVSIYDNRNANWTRDRSGALAAYSKSFGVETAANQFKFSIHKSQLPTLKLGDRLTATATTTASLLKPGDVAGSTSEFSPSFAIFGPEICGNGIDDDGDGLTDGADPDCYQDCIIVTNTKDAGYGSLRQAIICANNKFGLDTIKFNIPKTDAGFDVSRGVFKIDVLSILPTITDSLLVDGLTQTKFTGNSNAVVLGTGAKVGVDGFSVSKLDGPEIEIYGGLGVREGLIVASSRFHVRGLAMYAFFGTSIELSGYAVPGGLKRIIIEQNVLSSQAHTLTAPTYPAQPYWQDLMSVKVIRTDDLTIRNNMFANSGGHGIQFRGGPSKGAVIEDNEFSGNAHRILNRDGIELSYGGLSDILIRNNHFHDNSGTGIDAYQANVTNVRIEGNTFERNGLGNSGGATSENAGIRTTQSSGMLLVRNVIQSNYGAGVLVSNTSNSIIITENRIRLNGSIGNLRGDAKSGQYGIDLHSSSSSDGTGGISLRHAEQHRQRWFPGQRGVKLSSIHEI